MGPRPMALLLRFCGFPLCLRVLFLACLFFLVPPFQRLPFRTCRMIMNLVVIRLCLLHHSANRSVSTNNEGHCLIVGLLGYMTNISLAFSTHLVCFACKFMCICLTSNQVPCSNLTLFASYLYTCCCISSYQVLVACNLLSGPTVVTVNTGMDVSIVYAFCKLICVYLFL